MRGIGWFCAGFVIVVSVLIWLVTGTAGACGLCAGYNATVHVDTKVEVQGDRMVGFAVSWTYSDYLTRGMFGSIDPQGRPKPSEAEIEAAKNNIESNAIRNNYYFSILINDKPAAAADFSNAALGLNKDGQVVYSFDISLDCELSKEMNLKIWFLDPESYVNFFFSRERVWTQMGGGWKFTHRLSAGQLLAITTRRLAQVSPGTDKIKTGKPAEVLSPPSTARVKRAQKPPSISTQEPWWRSHLTLLRKALASLKRKLNTSLQRIKAGEGVGPLLFILGISFLYGLLHAAGPGHGKTLMASYLVACPEQYRVVILMALGIGAVHILTGVSVAMAVYFFLNVVLPKAMSELSFYTSKIAGVLIILVAIYLLYSKMKHGTLHPHGHNQQSSGRLHSRTVRQMNKFVVVAAGLVPCPGLVLLFLFCLALEMYFVGFLSAVAMSLGIASIQLITGSAILAARKTLLTRVDKASAILEYGAVALIFTLGLILFFFNPTLLTPLPTPKSP
jgi:ABC-type nickel/cobalt efflux system permease component RcnA